VKSMILRLLRRFPSVVAEFGSIKAIAEKLKSSRDDVNEIVYDFYRCVGCRGLFTRLREIQAFHPDHARAGTICSCGSLRYSPSWPRWYEWPTPKVMWFVLLRYLKVI